MGLIAAGLGAASGVLRDQYKEYFYCDALDADILAARGKKRGKRGFNNGSDNIITSGSVVAVNDGQCMIIVDQGKIVDLCSEPGEYRYDASTSPSVFAGGLAKGVADSFEEWKRRVSFGGDTGKDQRVYYINTKEIVGNKYGTPNPVPFRVVDANIGLDVDIAIACHGEYSYRIEDPILFYRNVCGNVDDVYARSEIDSQLKTELLTALQPAFAKISEMGIRYSAVPAHTAELALALNQVLSDKWEKTYGIRIASFGISSMKASEEDEKMIKDLQRAAVLRNPTMAAATLTSAQAQAMQDAARNTAAGRAATEYCAAGVLDLPFLRAGGKHRKVLRGLRQSPSPAEDDRPLDLPFLRAAGKHREFLHGMRCQKAVRQRQRRYGHVRAGNQLHLSELRRLDALRRRPGKAKV